MKAIRFIIQSLITIAVYIITIIPCMIQAELTNINGWALGISIVECCTLTIITIIGMEKFGRWFDSKLKQDEEKSQY